MTLYGAGAALSASVWGVTLAAFGSQVLPPGHRLLGLLLVLLAAGALGVLDLRRTAPWAPGLRRQTVPQWRTLLGRRWAAFLWGVDLGLGFTTIRVTSLYWLVALIVLVRGSLPLGASAFIGYALAQTAGLLWAQQRAARCGTARFRDFSVAYRVRAASARLLLAWSLCLAVATVATPL